MIVSPKNGMADREPLAKEKYLRIMKLLKLIEQKQQGLLDSDKPWTLSDEELWQEQVKTHMNVIAWCDEQLQWVKDTVDEGGPKLQEQRICDKWDLSTKLIDDEFDEIKQQLESELQDIASELNEFSSSTDAIDPGKWDKIKQQADFKQIRIAHRQRCAVSRCPDPAEYPDYPYYNVFVIPPNSPRLRFVYADNPDEPIRNGTVLYWHYVDGPLKKDQLEIRTSIWNRCSNTMTAIGMGRTDSNGFILQSIPYDQTRIQAMLDLNDKRLVVKQEVEKEAIETIAAHFEKEAEKHPVKPFEWVENPDPATCPIHDQSKNPCSMNFLEDLPDWINGQKIINPSRSTSQGQFITPFDRILENFVFHGFSPKDQQAIDELEPLENKTALRKLNPVSMQYFLENKQYGFMAYPVDRGSFATRPLTEIPGIDAPLPEGQTTGGTAEPTTPGKAAWRGFIPRHDDQGVVTIALHCTLPEWDRRINEKLHTLLNARQALDKMIAPHEKNRLRLLQATRMIDYNLDFGINNGQTHLSSPNKELHELSRSLYSIKDSLESRVYEPEKQEDLQLKNIIDNCTQAAEDLWQTLKNPAFADEYNRYIKAAFGEKDEQQASGETNGAINPGPYMQAEPYWTHIFETIAKSYHALKDTLCADDIWNQQVGPFFLELINSTREMDLEPSGEIAKDFFAFREHGLFIEEKRHEKSTADKTSSSGPIAEDHTPVNVLKPLNDRYSSRFIGVEFQDDALSNAQKSAESAANILKNLPGQYLAAASIFHRSPGPRSTVEWLLDGYFADLSQLLAKYSTDANSAHIRLVFGIMRISGILTKEDDIQQWKNIIFWMLRDAGRMNSSEKIDWKKILDKQMIDRISKALKDRKSRKPEIDESFINTLKSIYHIQTRNDSGQAASPSDVIFTARNHFGYKAFMQTFNLMLLIEAWGNLAKADPCTPGEAISYATDVLETSFSTMYSAAKISILGRNFYLKHFSSVSSLKDPFLKNATQFAEVIGYKLSFIAGASSLFQAFQSFGKQKYLDSFLHFSQALSVLMIASGELISARFATQTATGAAAKFLARRGAAILLGGGNFINLLIFVSVTLANIIRHYSTSHLNHYISGLWGSLKDETALTYFSFQARSLNQSYFIPLEQKKVKINQYSHSAKRLYFYTEHAGNDKEHFENAEELIAENIFGQLSWRAIVPMYLDQVDFSTIEKSVAIFGEFNPSMMPGGVENGLIQLKIDLKTYEEHMRRKAKSSDPETAKQIGMMLDIAQQQRRLPMQTAAIINFYKTVADPNNRNSLFDNKKRYAEVAKDLEKGDFIPDRDNPELLPIQKAYTGDNLSQLSKANPGISSSLIYGAWNSPDFFKERNSMYTQPRS